jgi:hypothetical protein
MKLCNDSSDCRDGYVCASPRLPTWSAVILDDNQNQKVCIPSGRSGGDVTNVPDAGVCQRSAPSGGGGFVVIDAGIVPSLKPDAGTEAGGGGADAGFDATVHVDGGDAGEFDGGLSDASDASN